MPSKYTNRLRRGTLTSKRGNKDYYKGYGARTEGVHTTKGAYVVLPERLMKIVAPDMSGFQVRGKHRTRPPCGIFSTASAPSSHVACLCCFYCAAA